MNRKIITTLLLPTILISPFLNFAQGDLMIMPKRIVFDGSQRSHEISLANTGNDSATYAISFIQYRMKEDGSFQQITQPDEDQRFADEFLRYYPRRVNLAPNEAQTVRLQLTRTSEIKEGEYRSHLYFRAVEKQTALGSEDMKENDEGISINIRTVFGISIPVIIRKGDINTQIDLNNISIKPDNILSMDIERKGNMSVYGNLSVIHKSETGKETEVGLVKGIAVYTPNTSRHFLFKLQNLEGVDLNYGKLIITYKTEEGKVFETTDYQLE